MLEQGNRSHWKALGPFGTVVEWDAELIGDRENELIAWRSIEGGNVDTAGSVHFETLPHDRGTVISVSLKYDPPGGKMGEAIATLLGDGLEHRLEEDLRAFKQIMEAGESPIGGTASARATIR